MRQGIPEKSHPAQNNIHTHYCADDAYDDRGCQSTHHEVIFKRLEENIEQVTH